MVITDKLIYLELQKTASAHIEALLTQLVGGKQLGVHKPFQGSEYVGKAIIGSIRNPWDWYVSVWAYGCSGRGGLQRYLTQRGFKKILLGVRDGRFAESWHELIKRTRPWKPLYRNSRDVQRFRRWLKLVCDPRQRRAIDWQYSIHPVSRFAGLMTYRYGRLYLKDFLQKHSFPALRNLSDLRDFDKKSNLLNHVICVESLEDDLIRVLGEIGYRLSPEDIDFVRKAKREKENTSEHGAVAPYYDQAAVNLVAQREAFIVQKYGYQPPVIFK